jgi:hypothetical protein
MAADTWYASASPPDAQALNAPGAQPPTGRPISFSLDFAKKFKLMLTD